MGSCTLQKRLDKLGIAYADLVDQVRTELCKTKLQSSDLTFLDWFFARLFQNKARLGVPSIAGLVKPYLNTSVRHSDRMLFLFVE